MVPVECALSEDFGAYHPVAQNDLCPQCGAELSQSSTADGLCLGCLLKVGLESGTSEAETLVAPLPEVPGYQISKLLGSGGMGTVYLALEESLDRRVALKVMTPGAQARFLREARTMASVEHPNIVRVYSVGRARDGRDVLAMELVEGETLAERIRRRGCLEVGESLSLTRQVVEALAAAWERGVVHRDIKPSNLFVDSRDRIRVGDFGLARPFEPTDGGELTRDGELLGTPAYLSPEQARGESVDFRTDIYSLGVVLFEMLDGDPPFDAQSPMELIVQHIRDPLPVLRIQGRGARARLEGVQDLLRWMTEKDRLLRPGSYEELLAAVDDILAERTEPGPGRRRDGDEILVGRLVAKRCDRLRQMMAFARHFRENRMKRPGRPLVYLVHGEEGHGHDALVERFVHEHVARSLDQNPAGGGGGVMTRRLSWPRGASPAELRGYLVTDLFTELDPSYSGIDASAPALVRRERLSLFSAVIVQHEIRTSQLDPRSLELMDWYVNQFWSSVQTDSSIPQFLVFLQIIYSRPRRRGLWRRFVPIDGLTRRASERRIRSILEPQPDKTPRLILSELGPITLDHVKEWFSLHNVLDSDMERRQRAEKLFTTRGGEAIDGLPMDDVEHALSHIHAEFLQRKGLHP